MIVFIVGCGRSGTHLAANFFESSDEVKIRYENTNEFTASSIAIQKNFSNASVDTIIKGYHNLQKTDVIIEKNHVTMWFYDKIIQEFPQSKFIYILREPYQIINSMKSHGGVQHWYDIMDMSQKNKFLGITQENYDKFGSYSQIEKYANKVKSHQLQLEEMKRQIPSNLLVIDYDKMVLESQTTYDSMCDFVGLEKNQLKINIKTDNHKKWQKNMERNEIELINKVLSINV